MSKLTDEQKEQLKTVEPSVQEYFKIFALFLLLPFLAVVFVNEGVVLGKIFSWFRNDVKFWSTSQYVYLTLAVFLMPLLYLYWFYYLTLQRSFLQFYNDFFQEAIDELGHTIAKVILELHAKGEDHKGKFDIGVIITSLNRMLSKLPGFLEWLGRKLFDQIPIMDFVNSYDMKDVDKEDKDSIAFGIATKLDEVITETINSFVPGWLKFIIPFNIVLVVWYLSI